VLRFVATFLIVLVGAMALVPHALCPCALRARAEAARAEAAGGARTQASDGLPMCCERCRARVRSAARPLPAFAVVVATAGNDVEREAPTCPCCQVSGKGKNLLQPGASVKPLELADSGPAVEPTGAQPLVAAAALLADAGTEPPPSVPPPALLRAGIVLLI
jgi:hypothetical protein